MSLSVQAQYSKVCSIFNPSAEEEEIDLRTMVSRSVCLGIGLTSGVHDQIFFFLSDDCVFLDVERRD
jgi:hypothetical protein